MTFKFTVARAPFAVEFEVGSVSEGIGVLQSEGTEFAKLFDISFGDTAITSGTVETPDVPGDPPKKRGRKPAAEAVAPPPMPVPPPAAAPVDATPGPNGIPAFLDRTAAPAPPPPPLMPPAAAPPVAPPVTGPVGHKVIAYCEPHLTGPDKGQALADWFAGAGLTIKGATLAEVVAVIRMTTDDKLAAVATALAV